MKTMKIKNVILTLMLLTGVTISNAQSRYLKIKLDDTKNNYVSFPPQTKFELKNEQNEIVYSDKDSATSFVIDKAYKLTVYPNWKKTTEVFNLKEGKIERPLTSLYEKTSKNNNHNYGRYDYDESKFTNGLSMKKTLTPSSINPGLYNAVFEFNNGITATYTDGELIALLNDEPLKIENKFFIYSKDGLIKLSFRPTNGETWWVFEPKK